MKPVEREGLDDVPKQLLGSNGADHFINCLTRDQRVLGDV